MLETQERRKNKTNTIRLLPSIQLQSLRKTESESFVPYTDKGRWPRNLVQGSQTQPQHSSSCDWQAQPRREEQPTGRYQVPPPVPFSYQSNSNYRDEVQSPFQPVERPVTYSESPTGLFNPPPIALTEWNQLYGFPGNTYPPGDGFVRPSAVKKVVENIRKSDTCTFSKIKATSSEVKNEGLKREGNKSPKVRLTLSTNCIYEPDSTLMWRRIFPNCSDTAMDRVLSPSLIKSEEDVASQSPSDHTIVGDQSITTCDSFAEERFVVLNDNSDIPHSSSSLRAPPHIRSELASSRSDYNTAPLVSRSSSSEEDNVYIAPQRYNYQIPRPNTSTSKTGGFPKGMYASGSYSTSSFESAVDEPMSASTRNSSRSSDGRSSGTSPTSQSSPVREGRTSGKSSTRKLSPVCDGHTSGTLSTQSSLYAMDSDSEMRKTSLPVYPNVTHSYLEKVQNEPCQKIQKHFAEIGSYYKKCYDHGRIYDVRFIVDNEILYAHRGALCAVSPYFESIFIENSQIRSKAITEIRLRGLSTHSLKTFLDFAYTGKLKVVATTILDLVKISTQFKIPYIKEKCIKELETLKFEDLLMLLVAVREDTVHEFTIPILRCISRKFLDISICKYFLELDIGTLCAILSYDELVTSTEVEVFSAGLEWINARPNERIQHLETIMKCIRFPLMSQQDLVDCMDRCSLLTANDNCISMIFKANWIRTVLALNRQDPLNLNMPDSRCLTANEHSNNSTNHINNNATPVNVLDISFGSIESFENYSMYSESFAGSRESFEQPSPSQETDGNFAKERKVYQTLKPELNDNSSMIVLGQKLYVIGGLRYNNDNPLPRRDVWVYCPERGWRKLTSLRTARMHHALCVFDGCIYAIGGLGRNKRILKSVECYNPSTNSWHFVKSLSTPRAGACAAELNGELFVAGGFGYSPNGNSTILDSVECYQPSTDRWIAKGSLRYGRCHAAMTCIANKLYLSGGLAFDKNSSLTLSVQDVDLYDANKDSWMLRTYMDKARHSSASFASGNKMYLIGGLSSNQREDLQDDIECWDVQRNAWLTTFKLPTEVQWMKGLA